MVKKQKPPLTLDVELARWTSRLAGELVPTGLMPLDYVLDGGLRVGRIMEVFGPEQSGKTTIMLHIVSAFLQRDKYVVYVDTEHALDEKWAKLNGVDVSNAKFVVIQPDTTNAAFEAIERFARYKEVALLVLDSLPALALEEELEAEDYHSTQPGLLARAFNRTLRILTSLLPKTGACFVFSNQLRSSMAMYGAQETTPGGRMKNYATSYRLEVRKKDWLGTKQAARGILSTIRAAKNKCGQPYRTSEVYITTSGLDVGTSNFELLVSLGLVTRSGNRYALAPAFNVSTSFEKSAMVSFLSEKRNEIYNTFLRLLGEMNFEAVAVEEEDVGVEN